MFGKLSKNAHNVSHKIFHNLQIPVLCGFIAICGNRSHSQTSFHAVYLEVTHIFSNAQNRIALTALTALINLGRCASDPVAAARDFAEETEQDQSEIFSCLNFKSPGAHAITLPEAKTSRIAAPKLRARRFLQFEMAA